MIRELARTLYRRGAAAKLGADLLGRLIQYALLWAAARSLTQGDFGDFTFALSTGYMLAQVADFGLQLFVQRELARMVAHDGHGAAFRDPHRAGRLIGGGLLIKCGLSVVALLCMAGAVLLVPVGNKGALLLLGVATVLNTSLDYFAYCFRALGRLRWEAGTALLARGLTLGAGAGLLVLGGGVWGLAAAAVAAVILAIALSYKLLGRYVKPVWRVEWAFWRASMWQPTAVGLGIVFSIVTFRVDNLLIVPSLGREAVGVYNVAYKLFEPTLIIPGVLLAATFPLLASAGAVAGPRMGEFTRMLKQTSLALAALGAAVTLSLVLLAYPVVNLLFGQAYVASAPVLQLLALACLPMYLNYALTHALIALDLPRLYAAFTFAALIVNVAANLLLIPRLGLGGAALATVASELALFALCASSIIKRVSAIGRKQPDAGWPLAPQRGKPREADAETTT